MNSEHLEQRRAIELREAAKRLREMTQNNNKALNYLLFMKSHGYIGPDSDGNAICKRCTTALNRAISALKKNQ